jgi:hypothetical protein
MGQTYESDWPISADFFASRDGTVESNLLIPGWKDWESDTFVLPEPAVFVGDVGFDDAEGWSTASLNKCYTDDVAFSFSWTPSDVKYTAPSETREDGAITGQETYVQISVDYASMGWFGLNGSNRRAVVTVPDSFGLQGGMSHVDVPASVMDQFPSIITPGGGLGGAALVMDTGLSYGYLFISAVRVTDYSIYSKALHGDIVLSYATGDIGIYSWTNPHEGCL